MYSFGFSWIKWKSNLIFSYCTTCLCASNRAPSAPSIIISKQKKNPMHANISIYLLCVVFIHYFWSLLPFFFLNVIFCTHNSNNNNDTHSPTRCFISECSMCVGILHFTCMLSFGQIVFDRASFVHDTMRQFFVIKFNSTDVQNYRRLIMRETKDTFGWEKKKFKAKSDRNREMFSVEEENVAAWKRRKISLVIVDCKKNLICSV